eukprot:UN00149
MSFFSRKFEEKPCLLSAIPKINFHTKDSFKIFQYSY